jgi:hypothetical protein
LNIEESTIDIPRTVREENTRVVLCVDIFFILGSPFFTSISRNLMFTTASALKNRKKGSVYGVIKSVIGFYATHDYYVKTVLADNEFGTLKEKLMNNEEVDLNLGPPKAHIPEVERNIRAIKDRLRSVLSSMHFEFIPKNFKIELVLACVVMLNMIPRQASASPTHSPWSLITGRAIDYKKHFCLEPGAFCMVHEENAPTNSMVKRATEAIAIGPCTSLYGVYRFLSLDSGRIIRRRAWSKLPIHDRIIERVEELADGEDKHIDFKYGDISFSTRETMGQLHVDEPIPVTAPNNEPTAGPAGIPAGNEPAPESDDESVGSGDDDTDGSDNDDEAEINVEENDNENGEDEPATLL